MRYKLMLSWADGSQLTLRTNNISMAERYAAGIVAKSTTSATLQEYPVSKHKLINLKDDGPAT